MPAFFDEISRYGSVSVVGTAKNVGKTFCLQRILSHYRNKGQDLAVTSIGVDGENTDVLFRTPKPELTFYPGMLVQTSETHYRRRFLTADILELSRTSTALGRLVTARVTTPGRLILSGPSDTEGLKTFIAYAHKAGQKTVLIDGALSRMSLASSAVAQAMILCTGAALSKRLDSVVQDAVFRYRLMQIPPIEAEELPLRAAKTPVTLEQLDHIRQGVWGLSNEAGLVDLGLRSALVGGLGTASNLETCDALFVSGMLSDRFLQSLCERMASGRGAASGASGRAASGAPLRLIVSDFTKIFVQPITYQQFLRRGGDLRVLRQTKLLAVCANPWSIEGYAFDSARLCEALSTALNCEVFDLAKTE